MEQPLFRTHAGEMVSGERLAAALDRVANEMIRLEYAIRKEDAYADHVSEEAKERRLIEGCAYAEDVRRGRRLDNFTIWQRVNQSLTGECVALLP